MGDITEVPVVTGNKIPILVEIAGEASIPMSRAGSINLRGYDTFRKAFNESRRVARKLQGVDVQSSMFGDVLSEMAKVLLRGGRVVKPTAEGTKLGNFFRGAFNLLSGKLVTQTLVDGGIRGVLLKNQGRLAKLAIEEGGATTIANLATYVVYAYTAQRIAFKAQRACSKWLAAAVANDTARLRELMKDMENNEVLDQEEIRKIKKEILEAIDKGKDVAKTAGFRAVEALCASKFEDRDDVLANLARAPSYFGTALAEITLETFFKVERDEEVAQALAENEGLRQQVEKLEGEREQKAQDKDKMSAEEEEARARYREAINIPDSGYDFENPDDHNSIRIDIEQYRADKESIKADGIEEVEDFIEKAIEAGIVKEGLSLPEGLNNIKVKVRLK